MSKLILREKLIGINNYNKSIVHSVGDDGYMPVEDSSAHHCGCVAYDSLWQHVECLYYCGKFQ